MECSHSWTSFSRGGRMLAWTSLSTGSPPTLTLPELPVPLPTPPQEGPGQVPVRQGTCHLQHPGQTAEGRTPHFQGAERMTTQVPPFALPHSASSLWRRPPRPATRERQPPLWWCCRTQQTSVRTSGECAGSLEWRWSSRLDSHSAQCWPRWRTLYQWWRRPRWCTESTAVVARSALVRPGEGWRPSWENTKKPAEKGPWRSLQ